MEAIVPAFLLALFAQACDRPAMLTAILADRYRRPLAVALAAFLAHLAGNAFAAAAGAAVAPMMTPNARALLLALALVFGAFAGTKPPSRLEGWRLGAFATALLGTLLLALGDRTLFFTFALAARGEPAFAAAGASMAAGAVAFVASVVGERGWTALPLRWLRLGGGAALLVAGLWIGLGALRLI